MSNLIFIYMYIYIYIYTGGIFCPLSPKPIHALCLAAHSRFAKSGIIALRALHSEAPAVLGNSALVRTLPGNASPFGNIGHPPLLQDLINALGSKGS